MDHGVDEVIRLLEQVGYGQQFGVETARQLESAILEAFPGADDDERFEHLLHVLASYEPEGGPYLYNASALAEECRRVLALLKK